MMQNQGTGAKGKPPAQLKAIPLRGSRGYTPRTGKLPAFIDTAKMTDYQFDTAKKIGIIKPLSGSRRNIDREETRKALADNRREKRDAVISARRGLLK